MKRCKRRKRRTRKAAAIAIIGLLIIGMAQPAQAANAGDKLYRGIVNMGTCVLEVPKHIHETSKEHNPFAGLTTGSAKGSGYALARGGVGCIETATFPFPKYEPIMEPEFVFGKE
ncbi:MAG: exosortase system-associated protein, TIGR04073 family [Candidatus Omnitrophica bacterium]|nr:exosortase system-associated protein, TIGR04073 family [Candidatus Omnitrophota bacterium]